MAFSLSHTTTVGFVVSYPTNTTGAYQATLSTAMCVCLPHPPLCTFARLHHCHAAASTRTRAMSANRFCAVIARLSISWSMSHQRIASRHFPKLRQLLDGIAHHRTICPDCPDSVLKSRGSANPINTPCPDCPDLPRLFLT